MGGREDKGWNGDEAGGWSAARQASSPTAEIPAAVAINLSALRREIGEIGGAMGEPPLKPTPPSR